MNALGDFLAALQHQARLRMGNAVLQAADGRGADDGQAGHRCLRDARRFGVGLQVARHPLTSNVSFMAAFPGGAGRALHVKGLGK